MASETVHHTAMTLSEHLPILEILVPFVRGTPDCVHWPPRSGMADRLYC